MALIASIDGPTRRIYLGIDSTSQEVHPIDIYKEMRTLRRTDENLRKFDVFMSGFGMVQKKPGSFTERYVVLNSVGATECLIVPYDSSHQLLIIGTVITDTGKEGRDCFDRSPLTPGVEVDIDYQPPQVEVIERGTSGLTAQESQALLDIASDQTTISGNITTIQGDIASINSAIITINTNITTIEAELVRLLGLQQENYCADNAVYIDVQGQMLQTDGRFRLYDNPIDAENCSDANVIATYQIKATYAGQEMTNYQCWRVS